MGGSYDETMREVVEECGHLQSGVRFQQEKRRRTEESPDVTGTENFEKGPQGPKQPYNEKGDD